GLEPGDVDLVEGHGTGTRLGDPIEAEALLATYGQGREVPVWLGSVKSNIGHTQAAAGVAGVIKAVMALRHGVLPRTLHVDERSPHVDWSGGSVELLAENRPWPGSGRPRRAAVSSFGLSGTNAHTVLEEFPLAKDDREPTPLGTGLTRAVPFVLSAATPAALRGRAAHLREVVGRGADLDLAASLATGTARLRHRAVVIARDAGTLRGGLDAVADGSLGPNVVLGEADGGGLAFVFTGQGAQRLGMGRELYEAYPVFADAFDAVCARVDLETDRPLKEVVHEDGDALDRTEYAQPALFALEVALFRLVESWGITPDALVGHSVGELAAAHAAGVLSLDDACRLVAVRGRLMQALPEGGAMLAVEAAENELELPAGVDLAAVNGPVSLTVSGEADAIRAFEERLRAEGRKAKRLSVSHAFHSHLMEPMLDEFATAVASTAFAAPTIPVVTTSSGDLATAAYWVRQVREPVRFADAVRTLRERGVTQLLELGPDGVLTALAENGVAALRRGRPETDTLMTAVAHLHAGGVPVDWRPLLEGGRRTPLPAYAFDRRRYWPAPKAGPGAERRRHHITWTPAGLPADTTLDGRWAVLGPRSDALVADVVLAVEAHGGTVTDRAEGDLRGVLTVPAAGDGATGAVLTHGLTDILHLLKDVTAPVWCLTRGAVSTGDGDPVASPAQAQLWGLGRVAALEHPDRWGGLVDVPETFDGAAGRALAAVLGGIGEDQVALRADGVLARRLAQAPVRAGRTPWRHTGATLITGGTGALGGHVARWLAGRGAKKLVLASRSGTQAPRAARLVAELGELGCTVVVVACDVADKEALAALLTEHPVEAVVHASGAVGVMALAEADPDSFAEAMRAKVSGARNLDELLPDVREFVLFSSIAGVWGSGGQAAYAAANAHLDALAERRRAQGRAATSIAWGRWAGEGMAAGDEAADYLLKRGIRALDPQQALAALGRAVESGETCVTVADIDWGRFTPVFTAVRPSPLLSGLIRPDDRATAPVTAPAAAGPGLRERLTGMPEAERNASLLSVVLGAVAAVLGHVTGESVDARRPFGDLGFDSLTAVELRDRLRAETGLDLPSSLVFDHPTPADLVRRLHDELGPVTGAASLLSELDTLEAEFVATPPDGLTRARVAVRLQSFLSRWADERQSADPDDGTTDLDDVTDEEMLSLIDRELGL
ncbi:type I polyketide synthase, partial [Streptomyces sp. NPDC002793]|uniref:type I polyketide synthase n=1 Tax=Streptomyces sp. NPDC002793 TaxID=3154432 RepID=UPI00332E8369